MNFSLRKLLVVVAAIGILLALYVQLTSRKTEIIRGKNATDIHGLRISGPYVIRANNLPSVAFTINECSEIGYARSIPFVVVIEHANNAEFSSRLNCGTRQFVHIFNDLLLSFDTDEIHVIHDISVHSFSGGPVYRADGSAAPLWDEQIDFYALDLRADKPIEFNPKKGRVFVVRFENGLTDIKQLNIPPFDHEQIEEMSIHELRKRIYNWWNTNKPKQTN